MNTWLRNPQDPEDEHDWAGWFADPTGFRDARYDPFQGWQGPPETLATINALMGVA